MSQRNMEDLFENYLHSETLAIAQNAGIPNGDIIYDRVSDTYSFRSDEDRQWWNELNDGWIEADKLFDELAEIIGEDNASELLEKELQNGLFCCDYEDMPREKMAFLKAELAKAKA